MSQINSEHYIRNEKVWFKTGDGDWIPTKIICQVLPVLGDVAKKYDEYLIIVGAKHLITTSNNLRSIDDVEINQQNLKRESLQRDFNQKCRTSEIKPLLYVIENIIEKKQTGVILVADYNTITFDNNGFKQRGRVVLSEHIPATVIEVEESVYIDLNPLFDGNIFGGERFYPSTQLLCDHNRIESISKELGSYSELREHCRAIINVLNPIVPDKEYILFDMRY